MTDRVFCPTCQCLKGPCKCQALHLPGIPFTLDAPLKPYNDEWKEPKP